MQKEKGNSLLYCASVCLAYAFVSVAITFVNKIVLTVYRFHFEQTLILLQLLVGTLGLLILSELKMCQVPRFQLKMARQAFPLAFWFFVYVVTGLGSLRSLTVPTWSAMRRLTAIFILILDYFIDRRCGTRFHPF
mmetsp:Transcript_20242/g.56079  ORF Transcript_20242/g.56079 Transcript_20242/m.56079 type:complete len:135 (+) Transcript_20242:69-473(+)